MRKTRKAKAKKRAEPPQFKPEFVAELLRAEKEKRIAIPIADFAKDFGLKKQRKP